MKLYVKVRADTTHSQDSAAAKALLSEIMRREYGIESFGGFSFGKHGKPFFSDLPYFFSYSHCKMGIACAVDAVEIGVDIQDFRKADKRVIERVCTKREAEKIASASDFAKIWAIKEAYSKMTGKGFAEGFSEIDTDALLNSGTARCALGNGFALAIASKKTVERLEIIYL